MTTETRDTRLAWLRRHHEVILLGIILLAALALRLYGLERSSLWLDELMQVQAARRPWWAVPKAALGHDGSAPLDYLITHFVYYHIGRSEGILRLPAVLWGVLSVATVYFLGKRMFDKTTGFLAAALLTILPSHIYYSQEVRPYSLPALMVLLATFAFYHAVSRNTRGAWALYGITLVIGMYSHYYVAIVGILHGAYLVLMALAKRLPWNRLLPYVVAACAAGLLFLPWPLSDTITTSQTFRMPGVGTLFSAPFVSTGVNYKFTLLHPLTWFAGFVWLSALAGVVLVITGGSAARNNIGLLAVVVLFGLTAVVTLDYTAPYFFSTRQFLPFAPLLILLGSAGALAIVRAVSRRLAPHLPGDAVAAAAAVVLVLFAAGTLSGALSDIYRYKKEDWGTASRYLIQYAHQNDVIIARHPYFKYYYAPELANQIIALTDVGTIQTQANKHARVWILAETVWRRYGYVPDVVAWIEATKPLEVKRFSGLRLYLYSATLTPQQLEATLKQW
ncbi:MAG: glycosyltransferase family 39 protein [Chloroflexi bacterium]|nr:glycosyltransferase family 39 protein [Chloroflexota bacterium]